VETWKLILAWGCLGIFFISRCYGRHPSISCRRVYFATDFRYIGEYPHGRGDHRCLAGLMAKSLKEIPENN
jgi:hypothetical protein